MNIEQLKADIAIASLDDVEALRAAAGDNEELLALVSDREGVLVEQLCFAPAAANSGSIDSNDAEEEEVVVMDEEEEYVPSERKKAIVATAVKAPVAPVLTAPPPAVDREAALAATKALRADLVAKIAACTDADGMVSMLVPELDLATRSADHKALRADIKAAVQARLKALGSAKPNAAAMREMFPELTKKAMAKFAFDMSHHGIAQRVVAETDGDLRYIIDAKEWMQWDGRRWVTLQDAQVGAIARNTANRAKAEAELDPAVDPAKLEVMGSNGYRVGVVGEMVAAETMHIERLDLDTQTRYLTCGNGAVDLHTKALVCDRELLATIKNDTAFNGDAKCPTFLRILNEAFEGRAADIAFYEMVMGYTIMGDPSERAMFFHIGEGLNGKSLLLGAIMKALGDHSVAVSYKVIADGPGMTANTSADGPSPSLRRLMAKRFAFIDELPMGGNFRDADVKKLAGGGGTISARGLNEKDVEFELTVVFNIACNTMLTIRGGQGAVWKRAFPIAYTKQFDDVEDTTLAKTLDGEREGILAWLINAAGKYREMKAKGGKLRDFMPQSSLDALARMQSEQNPFTDWIEENCEMVEGGFMSAQDGFENYVRHEQKVNLDGAKSIRSVKAFTQRMKTQKVGKHVPDYGPGRKSGFVGIRLKHIFDTSGIKTSVTGEQVLSIRERIRAEVAAEKAAEAEARKAAQAELC